MKYWLIFLFFSLSLQAQESSLQLGLIKYRGGGDWYANPSALTGLANFARSELGLAVRKDYATVDLGSSDIFDYPFLHMTGHGNVLINAQEAENLRLYLEAGGFVHVDDNYGMDPYFRKALREAFPDWPLQLLSPKHPLFHQVFKFPQGLPKIHQHDQKPPEAWALIHQGRVVLLYTYESDLSDGWEDPEVHKDPPELRRAALEMGANILHYAFMGREL